MRTLRLAFGVLVLSSAAIAAIPSVADTMRTNVSYDRSDQKPCRLYIHREQPAPKRCYHAFYDEYGPDVLVRGGMVFRDHQAFAEFRAHGGFRDYDRWAERQESRERKEYGPREAEDTQRERTWADRDSDTSSGGAGYGHRTEAAEASSGGASRGHQPEPYSGGASSD